MDPTLPEIDVVTLATELDSAQPPFVLDVRKPHEAAICRIDGAVLIPLDELPQHLEELPKDRAIVTQCHHGRRSAQAAQYLLDHGFTQVRNLAGGIDQWAVQIDPEMARY